MKTFMQNKKILSALLVILVASLRANYTVAATISVTGDVAATANIWSAGHMVAESLTGGAGSLAVIVNIPSGHDGTLIFNNITGFIEYGSCCDANSADGISAAGIGPGIDYRGIGGMQISRGRFLAGVFLNQ